MWPLYFITFYNIGNVSERRSLHFFLMSCSLHFCSILMTCEYVCVFSSIIIILYNLSLLPLDPLPCHNFQDKKWLDLWCSREEYSKDNQLGLNINSRHYYSSIKWLLHFIFEGRLNSSTGITWRYKL